MGARGRSGDVRSASSLWAIRCLLLLVKHGRPATARFGVSGRSLAALNFNGCTGNSGSVVAQPAGAPEAWNGDKEHFFDTYRPLREIDAFLDALKAEYPDLVQETKIGETWQKRPMRLLEIADRSSGTLPVDDRPCIFLQAGIHAREWIAS